MNPLILVCLGVVVVTVSVVFLMRRRRVPRG